MSLKLIN